MATCIVVFLFVQPSAFQRGNRGTFEEQIAAHNSAQGFVDRWGIVPCEITHLRSMRDGAPCNGYPLDHPERYPTKSVLLPLLAHQFLHGGVAHLLGNMLFLWVFTRALEERLGSPTVLALFLLGGLVAALGFVGLHTESTQPMLGASGSIAAIMGAYLVLRPRQRILSIVYLAGIQVVYLPAWAILGLFFATQFFTPGDANTAWEAHVIGMVFGAITGLLIQRFGRIQGASSDDAPPAPEAGLVPLAASSPSAR